MTYDPQGVPLLKHLLFGTRRRALVVSVIAALIAVSSAFAAWTVLTAASPASGKVGTLAAPTVVAATLNNGAALYPGQSGDLNVKVTNPNNALLITGTQTAAQTGSSTSDNASCPFSGNFTINPVTFATPIPLPAGVTDNLVLPGTVSLATNAPSACQGVTFTGKVVLAVSTP